MSVIVYKLCILHRSFKNLRVKEITTQKKNNINTAKEGFELKASSPSTETLPEVQPLLLDLMMKTTTVSIIFFKNASCYYMCNSCLKRGESRFSVLRIWPIFGLVFWFLHIKLQLFGVAVLHGLKDCSSLVFAFRFLSTMMEVF